jgi:hypothetical protein
MTGRPLGVGKEARMRLKWKGPGNLKHGSEMHPPGAQVEMEKELFDSFDSEMQAKFEKPKGPVPKALKEDKAEPKPKKAKAKKEE